MSQFVRGNRDLIKAMNRNLLLNIIRRESELSRTQLTEISGLSGGAVSQIVTELLNDGWLLEVGEGDYTGGRRQTLLRLNPTAAYAVGVKLMENRVVCAVTSFEATVRYYHERPIQFDDDPHKLSEQLILVIEETITNAAIPRDSLLGVGIGLAGVIYSQQGIVHYSPFFGWRDVPLAELLEQRLHLPVYVENDVNTLTLTEQYFGLGRHRSNFVVVTVGRGIGMGMVINGQLYQGARGGAGELGSIILDLHAARSGETATLELLASDPAVIDHVARLAGAMPDPATLDEIIRAADAGDVHCQEALARSGETIGMGLASVINILCPSLLIISGEGVAAGAYRLEPMLAALKQHTFNGLLDDVEVVIEPTDDQAWARGAASVVMSKAFESPLIEAKNQS
jgi:N-acetylglucosamine repressor